MNKLIFSTMALFLVMAMGASACHIRIHTYNSVTNADLEGVNVELIRDHDSYTVGTDSTDMNGLTYSWPVDDDYLYYTATGDKTGFVCITVNQEYTPSDAETWEMPCRPVDEVPEFGTIGAVLTLLGTGFFVYKKRK